MGGIIDFWVPALGFPVLAILVNSIVRVTIGLPQSALADFLLCTVLFDALVVMDHASFAAHVQNHIIRDALLAVYVPILFIAIVAWCFSLFRFEKVLLQLRVVNGGRLTLRELRIIFWFMVFGATSMFFSIAPFA
jgi:hypothetical protein